MENLRHYATKKHLMLWADAICINQSDAHERSRQVQLMHSIYRCAECVAIWLGRSADDSDLAMDKMTRWNSEYNQRYEPNEDYWAPISVNISSSNTMFYSSNDDQAWKAFESLTQRAWWGRAWIVQEATALGPSRTLLFCGSRIVDWSILRTTLHLSPHDAHVETQGTNRDFVQGMAAYRLDRFRYYKERGAYIRLYSVLELIRAFECQDPRDKLYASLGLAADISQTAIIPDYTKSVQDVYSDIARHSISQSPIYSLDFLGLVVRCPEWLGETIFDLPSWIPDLRVRIWMYAFERYLEVDDFSSSRAYKACGDAQGVVKFDVDKLHVNGFILDSIETVYPPCYSNLAAGWLDIEQEWRSKLPAEEYPLGGTVIEAFDHTLVADIGRSTTTSECLERGMKIDWDLLCERGANLTPELRHKQSFMLTDVKRTTFGRRLIKTRTGLIGLGPGIAEAGDFVCVLFGGHVLYALRQKNHADTHEFVGECYIHGMMDGQAMNSSNSLREFVIV